MNQSIFGFCPSLKSIFFENLFITQLTLGVATNYTINVVMERLDVLRMVTADMVYFVIQVEGIFRKGGCNFKVVLRQQLRYLVDENQEPLAVRNRGR